jgi:hypothetical protein
MVRCPKEKCRLSLRFSDRWAHWGIQRPRTTSTRGITRRTSVGVIRRGHALTRPVIAGRASVH